MKSWGNQLFSMDYVKLSQRIQSNFILHTSGVNMGHMNQEDAEYGFVSEE